MVGYRPENVQLSAREYVAAGAIAGIVTRALCQPLDVIKTRFQLQVEVVGRGGAGAKYSGVGQAAVTIAREEGLKGLWHGHNPGQLLSIVYGLVQFYSFELFTRNVASMGWGRNVTTDFVCGGLAGVSATVASFPFDVVRTRFIAQGNNKVYRWMGEGCKEMVIREGPSSLFKGLSPTILQVAPHAGCQFAFHNILSRLAKSLGVGEGEGKLGLGGNLTVGAVTGALAKSAVYPFDLLRKRLQLQGFQHARVGFGQNFVCHGLIECGMKTWRGEGVRGLYKGLSPSLIKAAVTTSLHFTVYDEVCALLRLTHQ